ncbi:MAG: succinate dehydrogenase, cytochrome b556 subunit [Myxococcota bacterium]
MSQPTNLGLGSWLSYRGGSGYLLWALHRVTGLGLLLFLALHIVDIFLLSFGPAAFEHLLVLYTSPPGRLMEIFLLFGVLFHAVNGLRIIVQDLFTKSWERRRHDRLIVVQLVVFLLIFLPAAWIMFGSFLESLS